MRISFLLAVVVLTAASAAQAAYFNLDDFAILSTGNVTLGDQFTIPGGAHVGALGSVTGGDQQSIVGALVSGVAVGSAINVGNIAHSFGACVSAGGTIDPDCAPADATGTDPLLTTLSNAITEAGTLAGLLSGLPADYSLGNVNDVNGATLAFNNVGALTGLVVFNIGDYVGAGNNTWSVTANGADTVVVQADSLTLTNYGFHVTLNDIAPQNVFFHLSGSMSLIGNLGLSGIWVGDSTCVAGGPAGQFDQGFNGALYCADDIVLGRIQSPAFTHVALNASDLPGGVVDPGGLGEVPEPSTYILLGTGLAALGLVRRFRRARG